MNVSCPVAHPQHLTRICRIGRDRVIARRALRRCGLKPRRAPSARNPVEITEPSASSANRDRPLRSITSPTRRSLTSSNASTWPRSNPRSQRPRVCRVADRFSSLLSALLTHSRCTTGSPCIWATCRNRRAPAINIVSGNIDSLTESESLRGSALLMRRRAPRKSTRRKNRPSPGPQTTSVPRLPSVASTDR